MKEVMSALLLLAGALVSPPLQPAFAAGWPTTGGNSQHNGQGSVAGPSAPQVLWSRADTSMVGSQVFAEGDRMVAFRDRGPDGASLVYYDLLNGYIHRAAGITGGRLMPVGLRDGQIYAVDLETTFNDGLFALDLESGTFLWLTSAGAHLGLGDGLTFTAEGDPLLPSGDHLTRIDPADGSIRWQVPWTLTSGATLQLPTPRLATFQDTVYSLESAHPNPGVVLVARDAGTGARRYASAPIPPAAGQTLPMLVGPDGAIYVVRNAESPSLTRSIHAFEDTGAGLFERWNAPTVVDPNFGPSALYGVGIDGNPIFVSEDGRSLVRRDSATGAVLSTSPALTDFDSFTPRLSVDSAGTVYAALSRGPGEEDRLVALDGDLDILWEAPFVGAEFSGPALAGPELLALAGRSGVTVYATGRELFADGFESGDASAWITPPVTPGNATSVKEKARLGGSTYGLVVKIQDNASSAYVESDAPDGVRTYVARFWIDPSQLDIPLVPDQNTLSILTARMNRCCQHLNLFLVRSLITGDFRLEAWVQEEDGFRHGAGIALPPGADPGPAHIQLEWRAAQGPDTEDGLIALDDLATPEGDVRRDLDNHGLVIDAIRIGTFANGHTGVTGSYFFDEFESFR